LKHLSKKRKRNQIEIPLVKAIETGRAHPEVFLKILVSLEDIVGFISNVIGITERGEITLLQKEIVL